MTEEQLKIVNRFLDEEGRIKIWPTKKVKQALIYQYLIVYFEFDRQYTEHEVNLIISRQHTFNDHFLLRRGLIAEKLMDRTSDGAYYWRVK